MPLSEAMPEPDECDIVLGRAILDKWRNHQARSARRLVIEATFTRDSSLRGGVAIWRSHTAPVERSAPAVQRSGLPAG